MIQIEKTKIIRKNGKELLIVEACGHDGIRVRATQNGKMDDSLPTGIDDIPKLNQNNIKIYQENKDYVIENGKIKCIIQQTGRLKFYNNNGDLLLEEYERNRFRELFEGDFYSALEIVPRTFQPISNTPNYHITVRFEAHDDEKFFGMGQYQQPLLNLKGCRLELAQRNSQVSIPFTISNRNYGFLWNNPAIGYATFAENVTEWYADSARNVDYWVTAGNSPKEIENNYAMLVGTSPEMPTFGLGFWQCKLRYQTQDELMAVAREYHKRNIPVSVIVADFFHWPNQGDWKFDSTYWPDPKKMVEELKNMGMELMVSVWPTVEKSSENYEEMKDEGYLIQTDHGVANHILSDSAIMDATNPACRKYVWNKIRNNYYKDGIHIFWLDEAEPELTGYEFDHYRFFAGSDKEIGNIYPKEYARMAFEGMQEEGMDKILNLIRCAWIGSQKYGALVWSGDIDSSFSSLRNQIVAGQNMGIAGISWWTTDIGGFCGADISDPKFKELLIRWFQFGTFCPVMRLHGYRKPFKKPIGTTGGGKNGSGADNEIWSFGTDVYDICKYYISLRESMKVYTAKIMHEAHETGTPVMRPLFYEFPSDLKCWDIKYSYMYGSDILVAPITEEKVRATKVYLPEGEEWIDFWSGEQICGGQVVNVEAPLEIIPLFIRASSKTLFQELKQ